MFIIRLAEWNTGNMEEFMKKQVLPLGIVFMLLLIMMALGGCDLQQESSTVPDAPIISGKDYSLDDH